MSNIFVTKPFFPPYEEFEGYLKQIWENGWLTNSGPLIEVLEQKLSDYLKADHLLVVTNGTIALQIAIRALNLEGEIITTPFSYVATTSSIVWEHCKPVMVDISPRSLNIDPDKIEQAITDKTTAILATHVFGNPCDVDKINSIAKKHNLRVIYDGAHAFGVSYKGRSVLTYGDISICSFHATKLFHMAEGGCLLTSDSALFKKISLMRNFGHASLTEFDGVGINGKNSEIHAAMGLANFKYIPAILERRKYICGYYTDSLIDLPVTFQQILPGATYNFAYYPVVFHSEGVLLNVMSALEKIGVYPRRYFYPSLSTLPYVSKQYTPIADEISKRVLCLPLYHTLDEKDMNTIIETIKRAIHVASYIDAESNVCEEVT